MVKNLPETIEKKTKPNLFDILISLNKDKKEIKDNFRQETYLLSEPSEMFNDFCLNNVIQSCFDYTNPKAMIAIADALITYALS
jgi:hypothetical protein